MKMAYGPIGLKDWNLPEIEKLVDERIRPALIRELEGIFEFALKENLCSLHFPVVYSPDSDGRRGKPVSDPLTIYMNFDFDGDGVPVFRTSLREILKLDMDAVAEDGSYRDGLILVRDALRVLVDDLDTVIQKSIREHRR